MASVTDSLKRSLILSLVRSHAAAAAAQGHAGAGPLAPGSGATSIGVNYLIKFTGGVRMR